MAMPKKSTRLITVDGVRYRWTATDFDRYLWADTNAQIQVQSVEPVGSLLTVSTVDWLEVVLPSHIAHVIRTAIRKGWKPLEPGPPFVRDVELNPFGGQEFDPKWRTESVVGLAAKKRHRRIRGAAHSCRRTGRSRLSESRVAGVLSGAETAA